ncbi:hypothetical protein TNCV_4682211 [Trichonephila clavipes]|nr:hypothetical protein TNCV_4682211 [Trichonephila clavipes]
MDCGCGSPVERVSDHGRHVMSSSPVPLETRRVGQRCTLNLSRAETSSRWSYQVRVKETLSTLHNVNTGAPQDSLLDPVTFNIYINDIPTHPQTSINIYTDDTAIAATYKNHNTIIKAFNNHLTLLENYFNTWKIKLNIDKTVAVEAVFPKMW